MRLPEDVMADIHIIRQDYARALNAYEAMPNPATWEVLHDITDRRARAMRSLHRDDNMGVREISAIFRCGKTVVRNVLDAEEE